MHHQYGGPPRRVPLPRPSGWRSLADASSRAAELIAPADTTIKVGGVRLRLAVAVGHHPVDGTPAPVGFQANDPGPGAQRDVRVPQCWFHADDVGIGLPVDQAGIPVAGSTADAGRELRRRLVVDEPNGQRERVQAGCGEVGLQLSGARLVAQRRVPVRGRRRRLIRVGATLAMDVVEMLCPRVPRFEIGVGQRPRRRDAVTCWISPKSRLRKRNRIAP